ncbi:MAG: ABC transporter substrate-binding protein [Chloroflexi bacterium]|nr:ABC transporter substrate-binding protein [Chloroflexota bacterium]
MRFKTVSGWRLLLLVGAIGFLAGGCATQPAAPSPSPAPPGPSGAASPTPAAAPKKIEKIKASMPGTGGYTLTFDFGREKGVYKEEGIDLETFDMPAALAVPALISGEAPYAGNMSNAMTAGWMGLPLKGIMGGMKTSTWYLVGGPGIKTAADLKGQKVGVFSIGAESHFVAKDGVKYIGLDPDKDVVYVAVRGWDNLIAALKTKSVSAISVKPPYNIVAVKKESGTILADPLKGSTESIDSNGLATTDNLLKNNRDQVKRMIRATLKSMVLRRDRGDEFIDFAMKSMGVERDIVVEFHKQFLEIMNYDGLLNDKQLQGLVKAAQMSGAIKGEPVMEKGVDFSALKEVLKEMPASR